MGVLPGGVDFPTEVARLEVGVVKDARLSLPDTGVFFPPLLLNTAFPEDVTLPLLGVLSVVVSLGVVADRSDDFLLRGLGVLVTHPGIRLLTVNRGLRSPPIPPSRTSLRPRQIVYVSCLIMGFGVLIGDFSTTSAGFSRPRLGDLSCTTARE